MAYVYTIISWEDAGDLEITGKLSPAADPHKPKWTKITLVTNQGARLETDVVSVKIRLQVPVATPSMHLIMKHYDNIPDTFPDR